MVTLITMIFSVLVLGAMDSPETVSAQYLGNVVNDEDKHAWEEYICPDGNVSTIGLCPGQRTLQEAIVCFEDCHKLPSDPEGEFATFMIAGIAFAVGSILLAWKMAGKSIAKNR